MDLKKSTTLQLEVSSQFSVCQHNPEGVVQHSVPLAILEVMVLLSNMASEGEAVNAAAAELETAEG